MTEPSAAKQLNSMLMPGRDLVAKVMGGSPTLSSYIQGRYLQELLPERSLSNNTLRDYRNKIKYIKSKLGHLLVDEILVKDIANFLKKFPPTQSNRYRSLISDIFKYIVADGLADSNPAKNTINRRVMKARKRLKLEEYQAIHAMAEAWLQNAMDLALLTLQRREDILNMKFSDIKADYLYVIQRKTEKHGSAAHIKIAIGPSLDKAIARCKQDNIFSPYLIHRLPDKLVESQEKLHHTQITRSYLSKAFAATREATKLFADLAPAERPTFHEIRSLGIKLYEDAGTNAQTLAGHTNRKMTEQYKVGHEIQWTEAVANLEI